MPPFLRCRNSGFGKNHMERLLKKKFKSKTLVRINWLDSQSPDDAGWKNKKDVDKNAVRLSSVGFIIGQTKTAITLAASRPRKRENSDSVTGIMCIARNSIQKIKEIS